MGECEGGRQKTWGRCVLTVVDASYGKVRREPVTVHNNEVNDASPGEFVRLDSGIVQAPTTLNPLGPHSLAAHSEVMPDVNSECVQPCESSILSVRSILILILCSYNPERIVHE